MVYQKEPPLELRWEKPKALRLDYDLLSVIEWAMPKAPGLGKARWKDCG